MISHWLNRCSLRLRLVLFVFVPLVGAIFALGFSVLSHLEKEGERRMQKEVELIARVLQAPLAHAMERKREGSVELSLQSAFRIGRVYGAYLYDDAGQVVATAGTVTPDREVRSSITRLVASGKRAGEYSEVAGRSVYSYFVPLQNAQDQTIGLLQITRRERDFRQYMGQLRRQAALFVFLGTGLMTGIVLLGYHSAVGRSLDQVRRSMIRIEAGDYLHRAPTRGPREIATLANSLNAMLNSIGRAREEIQMRRATEEVLERKLHRSEKLAALGQVAAGVAHELGAPLSLIDGKAQRALRHPEKTDAGPLNGIREQVRRMERLVRQLLEFGRPSSQNRKRIRADQLAEMAKRNLPEGAASGRAKIEFNGPRPGPELCVDPFRVELALSNLLQNALHAAPGGKVALFWEENDGEVAFGVADDGPGIPQGLEAAIFDPFFTTRKSSKGTGLGLAVVQQVAAEHNAGIEAGRSQWGGAEFKIIFHRNGPRAANKMDGSNPHEREEEQNTSRTNSHRRR